MNKAQKQFVEESFTGLGGIKSLTQNMMIDYLETYSKIDATPDRVTAYFYNSTGMSKDFWPTEDSYLTFNSNLIITGDGLVVKNRHGKIGRIGAYTE